VGIDWMNTPGGYYAAAYWLSCVMMIRSCPRRQNTAKTAGSLALFGAVLFGLMTVTHGSRQIFFIPLLLLYISMIWGTMYYNCRFDWRTSLYFTLRAFILGEFIASFEWQLFYLLTEFAGFPHSLLANVLLAAGVDILLTLLFYFLEQKNRDVNLKLEISRRELLSAGLIALAIFSVSNVSFLLQGTPFGSLLVQELFTIRTLIDLGGVAILYAFHVQMSEFEMRVAVERLNDMLEMQHNNYEVLEQSVNAVNQKYHDLKYQITVLKQEANAKESLDYLNQMEQDIKSYESQNKTGNKVLDTILTGKALYCQSCWIEMTSVADGKLLNFMDPMDISTLFGNILDNAIESVSKIEHKERRLIHVAVAQQKNFLRIRVENCCDQAPKFVDGIPQTTKKDKRYHGFGMRSIENTVKKYGGSVTAQAENGWFELRILIPLPEGQNSQVAEQKSSAEEAAGESGGHSEERN